MTSVMYSKHVDKSFVVFHYRISLLHRSYNMSIFREIQGDKIKGRFLNLLIQVFGEGHNSVLISLLPD